MSALILLLVTTVAQPYTPSFDCTKAATRVEKTICASAELSRLDELLDRFYFAARQVFNESPCLKDDQREWLKARNRCADAACLRDAYLRRLRVLILWQPGMNLPNDVEIPPGPRLRWIIPPIDPSDAPDLDSKPFEGRGVIGYVMDEGGYVLEADDGTLHTLIPEIVIDDASMGHLSRLQEEKVKVIVRGRHAVVRGTDPMFDNRYCIAIFEKGEGRKAKGERN